MDTAAAQALNPFPPFAERPAANVARRGAARLLDALTVLTILWMLSVMQVLWFMSSLSRDIDPEPWGRSLMPTVAYVVIALAYESFFVSRNEGQTPGKDFCNVRVVHDNGAVGHVRSILRAVPVALVWLIPPVWLAGIVGATFAIPSTLGSGRCLHDRLAGTRVIDYDRTREDPDAPPPPKLYRRHQMNEELDQELEGIDQ